MYQSDYDNWRFPFRRCGPQPNSKLLINYGFVDEENPYDRILLEVEPF